jgi:hypothetical protein
MTRKERRRLLGLVATVVLMLPLSPIEAAGGWYLLAPPLEEMPYVPSHPNNRINLGTPLSRWQHVRAFDSAAACEQMLEESVRVARQDFDKEFLKDPRKYQATKSWSDLHARCVASNDPRLE